MGNEQSHDIFGKSLANRRKASMVMHNEEHSYDKTVKVPEHTTAMHREKWVFPELSHCIIKLLCF